MTERELLAMAAKAAGNIWLINNANTGETYYGVCSGDEHFHGNAPQWNPLTDDGDALRLAVKLGITPHLYADCVIANPHIFGIEPCEEEYGRDHYAATRLAIVRAAAEIGRSMK